MSGRLVVLLILIGAAVFVIGLTVGFWLIGVWGR
jgi:hypothetical protein